MSHKKRKMSSELAKLCARVEQWRRDRGSPGAVIPEELWEEAVRVAEVDGVYATTQALRFNYMGLKNRMVARAEAQEPGESEAVPAGSARAEPGAAGMQGSRSRGTKHSAASPVRATPHFVPVGVPVPPRFPAIVVEVERGAGERLRVEVPGDYDVARLVQALWRVPS